MSDYSTKKLSEFALQEIASTLTGLEYGSVEIFVHDNRISQITKREIKKTPNQNPQYNNSISIKKEGSKSSLDKT
jgi:hypothetical protein